MTRLYRLALLLIVLLMAIRPSIGQITTGEITGELNTITSAVPFLMIAPDSRGGSMGDAGVVTSPDANSMHWNPVVF